MKKFLNLQEIFTTTIFRNSFSGNKLEKYTTLQTFEEIKIYLKLYENKIINNQDDLEQYSKDNNMWEVYQAWLLYWKQFTGGFETLTSGLSLEEKVNVSNLEFDFDFFENSKELITKNENIIKQLKS